MWRNRESAEIREEKQNKNDEKADKKKMEREKKEKRRGERRARKQEKNIREKTELITDNSEIIEKILEDNPLLRQKKIICFDLYWTLIYRPHVHWKTKHFLKKVWIEPFKKYYEIIQTHGKEYVKTAYESVDGFKMPNRVIHALQKHTDEEVKNTKIYPKALWVLKKLKNSWYKLALISNLSQDFEAPLRRLIPNDVFDYEALSYDLWVMKPDARIFKKVLDDANSGQPQRSEEIKMKDMLMIWDTQKHDVDWAKNVWMDAILIDRNEKNINYDEEKDSIIIHTLADLLDILWIDY